MKVKTMILLKFDQIAQNHNSEKKNVYKFMGFFIFLGTGSSLSNFIAIFDVF